ncbi:MAG: NADP-dependent oxidoreductase [Polyangia bacterium]
MKAIRFHRFGGPEVLQLSDTEEPHAGPGQVRMAVRAAGINRSDLMKVSTGHWKGRPIPLPSGVGVEGAGIVDELGAGVTGVALGDAIFGCGFDMLAEHAVMRPGIWALKPALKPQGLSFEEAGSAPVVVETSTRILDLVGLTPGETLLVSGAAGGVGLAVVQFARLRGAVVIGTASARNHDQLRLLGAIPTVYGPGLVERVRALAPQGVQAALDIAGSGVVPDLVELVGDPSRVVSIADFKAPEHGVRLSLAPQAHPERTLAHAARLLAEGSFRVPVAAVFALAQAAEAYRRCATGHAAGKIVISIPPL